MGQRRGRPFQVWLSRGERARLGAVSRRAGVTPSEWVRRVLYAEVRLPTPRLSTLSQGLERLRAEMPVGGPGTATAAISLASGGPRVMDVAVDEDKRRDRAKRKNYGPGPWTEEEIKEMQKRDSGPAGSPGGVDGE